MRFKRNIKNDFIAPPTRAEPVVILWLYPTASTLQPEGLPSFLVSIIQLQSFPFNPSFEMTHIIDTSLSNGLQRFLTTLQMSITLIAEALLISSLALYLVCFEDVTLCR